MGKKEEKKEDAGSLIDRLLGIGKSFKDIKQMLGLNSMMASRLFGQRVSKHNNKKKTTKAKRKASRKAEKVARRANRNKNRKRGMPTKKRTQTRRHSTKT